LEDCVQCWCFLLLNSQFLLCCAKTKPHSSTPGEKLGT
jgi:hypothetical protein